ncbi:MAG: 2-hydroxyacyl-CoA dehydratase [Candidatus Caldarchaeum sp.]|uniref:2-hydroxyacyl-CoA dehydratase n=1 Tax=Caldiarchaeum subterraneum TaxID=311458 RepID=A0A7C5QE82_CALS0
MTEGQQQALQTFHEVVEDSYTTFNHVRLWKQRLGRKALGYFPVYFPEELAHALNMIPVNILGASGRLPLDIATAHTQSFVCSITKSVFQLAAQGNLDTFDALIFSNICDVARNLSGIMMRNFGDKLHIDYIHYPINNVSENAVTYLEQDYRRVVEGLEKVSGKGFDEDGLAEAIKLYNRKRKLLNSLLELRREQPWLMPYDEYYLAVRAGQFMPIEPYLEALERLVEEVRSRDVRPADRVRVVVFGDFCEQPPLMFMKTVEDAGCYIVWDEVLVGARWIGEVELNGGESPLRALARAYVSRMEPLTVRYHPAVDKHSYMLKLVSETKAEGVVFVTPKFCEPALYDYMIYKTVLDKHNIPYLHLEYEESTSSFEHVRTMLETFAESIMFD